MVVLISETLMQCDYLSQPFEHCQSNAQTSCSNVPLLAQSQPCGAHCTVGPGDNSHMTDVDVEAVSTLVKDFC